MELRLHPISEITYKNNLLVHKCWIEVMLGYEYWMPTLITACQAQHRNLVSLRLISEIKVLKY